MSGRLTAYAILDTSLTGGCGRSAGLPNTHAAYGSVSAVQHDGTLAPVLETATPPAAAPGASPAATGAVGATSGLQVAADAGGASGDGGGGTWRTVGAALGSALALALCGAHPVTGHG